MLIALMAVAYQYFRGELALFPGQRWDPHEVSIKGFRVGVTPEQIEARLGPGRQQEGEGWYWSPPLPPTKPGGFLPTITFEMLSLEKRDHRWYLHGSQFEYHGQTLITMFRGAESVSQGTVQWHFGPGLYDRHGDDLALYYVDPGTDGVKLSFGINTIDEFGPGFTRPVWGTTLSWPETTPVSSASPEKPKTTESNSI